MFRLSGYVLPDAAKIKIKLFVEIVIDVKDKLSVLNRSINQQMYAILFSIPYSDIGSQYYSIFLIDFYAAVFQCFFQLFYVGVSK